MSRRFESREKLAFFTPAKQDCCWLTHTTQSCGWGSAVLFLAERFPSSTVTGFSNSEAQTQFILETAEKKGLANVSVIIGDVVSYEFEPESYDLVISVEVRPSRPHHPSH